LAALRKRDGAMVVGEGRSGAVEIERGPPTEAALLVRLYLGGWSPGEDSHSLM
jgi:hypothetical protein